MTVTLRGCMKAADGYTFLSMDASQIELRMMAFLSQDPQMISDVRSKDCHNATAIRMYGEVADKDQAKKNRYRGKQANFALPFGGSDEKMAIVLDCELEEAMEFRQMYISTYPRLFEWKKEVIEQAKIDGFVVTMYGRIRPIPELLSPNWKTRAKGEREGFNTIVQGSAVDTVKLQMLWMRSQYPYTNRLVSQVHDEQLWEIPDSDLEWSIAKAKELVTVFPDYPNDIQIGKYYSELKEVE